MKKKSFRMVIVYKAKPKVFLKWEKEFLWLTIDRLTILCQRNYHWEQRNH